MENESIAKYSLLFLPWILATLMKDVPEISYLIAYFGSFYIFYVTLSGKLKPLPKDRSIAGQLMRPIFLVQIIFAGYMCTTSIFYFLSILGYENFHRPPASYLVDYSHLNLTAQCQRYYCLGHAAFASGLVFFMKYPIKLKYYCVQDSLANLILVIALISFPVSELFLRVPGLSQFYYQFNTLSFIAGTLALAFAIPIKKINNTIICTILYLFNFYQALMSGFKEPIIISILVLGIFLYPNYKKKVLFIFGPLLIILFLLLPTFNTVFRQNAWSGETSAADATQLAFDAVLNNDSNDKDDTNWEFFTLRLSEIDMFIDFVQSTPAKIDFYQSLLLKQSAEAMVPRIIWPSKPNTEELIMRRVYDAGVVNENSTSVSAKPAFIVDAYLSYGAPGIFLFLFLYGAFAQIISTKAEELFGGYILGTALMFSGLFEIMWRGISFEFLINSVFWSFITMLIIFNILKAKGILKAV
jgi:hypothetical protein